MQLTPDIAAPLLMVNRVQPYSWGERGKQAFIARLLGAEPAGDESYAELWMGTHPNAPSAVVVGGEAVPLAGLIAAHPHEILGPAVHRRFGSSLPFLFKVLSAAEPLSIQVHPGRAQAERLHARDPEHYPDGNHKPEVAIALDGLSALVGFKPFGGIVAALQRYPELTGLVGTDVACQLAQARQPSPEDERALLRLFYSTLLQRSLSHPQDLREATSRLATRLRLVASRNREETLFLDLQQRYEGPDVGPFSALLLNYVQLEPGQGVFIPAGVPHAYLRGNIIECMAASDNVLRLGLTTKFVDIPTLLQVLTYELGPLPVVEPTPGATETVYHTPAAEFQVTRLRLASGEQVFRAPAGPQVLLALQGQALIRWREGSLVLRRGQSAFLPHCLGEYELVAETPAELYRAEVPPR